MASLTPLSKGLIALAVVGAMASAVWHLGLKDRLSGDVTPSVGTPPVPQSTPQPAPLTVAPPVPAESVASPEPAKTPAPSVEAPAQKAATEVGTETPLTPEETAQPTAGSDAPESRLSPAENAETGRKLMAAGDFAQARVHLELAVQGGDGGAACHLGEMTLKGQGGIAVDQAKAASLFQLAQSRNIICFASGQ